MAGPEGDFRRELASSDAVGRHEVGGRHGLDGQLFVIAGVAGDDEPGTELERGGGR